MQVNKWSSEVSQFVTPGDKTVFVWEPESEGPFPIISFAHGKNNGGQELQQIYDKMATGIAEQGFIVVAQTGEKMGWQYDTQYKDQKTALEWALANEKLAAKSKGTESGLMGFSMGGWATMVNANEEWTKQVGVGAAFLLHPWTNSKDKTSLDSQIPIFYTSGSKDRKVKNPFYRYKAVKGAPKIFAQARGANHLTPIKNQKVWGPRIVEFFSCHLKKDESKCRKIYKRGRRSWCKKGRKYSKCYLDKNESKAVLECRKQAKISLRGLDSSEKALVQTQRDYWLNRCIEVAECNQIYLTKKQECQDLFDKHISGILDNTGSSNGSAFTDCQTSISEQVSTCMAGKNLEEIRAKYPYDQAADAKFQELKEKTSRWNKRKGNKCRGRKL